MTLLDLIPELKRAATTGGGEYAGPCPFCGGTDRFRAWPEEGTTGKFWCRSCGKHGDGITLLRERDGLSFKEACFRLGVMPSLTWKGPHRDPTRTTWTPRPATTPGATWTDRAGAFLRVCQKNLAGPSGADCRAFLTGRGLHPETIERAGLGWNPGDRYESRQAWGLPPEKKENGRPRKVWLPVGLVISCFAGGRVIRLRVRRRDPGDGARYVIVTGSASVPMAWGLEKETLIIVESELDGLLLRQEAGDLAGVVALGSATNRPDQATDRPLKTANLLLIALDADQAGVKEAWGFWKQTYSNAKRWPVPIRKDPSEGWQAGLDLRAWVMAGLPDGLKPESKEPTIERATANQEAPGATNEGRHTKAKGPNEERN